MMTIKRKKKKRLGLCCYSNRWRNCKSIKFAGEQCLIGFGQVSIRRTDWALDTDDEPGPVPPAPGIT